VLVRVEYHFCRIALRHARDATEPYRRTLRWSLTSAQTVVQVWGIKCDVSDKKDVEALTNFAKDKCGTVHYWYCFCTPLQRERDQHALACLRRRSQEPSVICLQAEMAHSMTWREVDRQKCSR